jgi:DNA-directed RNA polymerase specialized sigma24 family protein
MARRNGFVIKINYLFLVNTFLVKNKNEIITALYNSNEVNDLIKKIKPAELQDDLKQYAFTVLCEKPDEFIIELNNKKQLKFFLVKIISNSVFSNRSGFLTQHKLNDELHVDVMEQQVDSSDNYHELIDKCVNESKNLYWYNQELLNLYSIHGSYRAVSNITKIPVKSIYNAIKKAKQQIKKSLWK